MLKLAKLVAVTTIVASGFAATVMAEPISLNVAATPSIFKPMFEKLAEKFEAENPDIKINLDASERDQTDMIQKLLRQSIMSDLPDVTFQGYNYIRTLVDRNLAVPLNAFVEGDADWTDENFSKSVTSSASINGTIYGLGVGMSFPVMYYNPDLLKKAQYTDPDLPAIWDEVIALGKKVGDANNNDLGIMVRSHSWVFQAMIESQGGRLMDAEEKKVTFSGAEGLKTFEILEQIGKAGQAATNLTREQGRQAFAAGTVGILIDSSSSLASFEKQVAGAFEVKTAPLPILSDRASIPAAGIASLMTTRDSARQAAAWKFMKYVSSPEGQAIVGKETGYVPANGVAVERAELLGDYYAQKPGMSAALKTLPSASLWYTFPGENALKIDKVIEDAMDNVVVLKETPETAVKALARKVEALLIE